MNIRMIGILALGIAGLLLGGCGGGGGGDSAPPPTPKATAKVYLFGTMSTATISQAAGLVDSLETTVTLPAGVFVNVTSLPVAGDPANTRRLKGGTIVASGPVQVTADKITALYNSVTRDLTITMLNTNRAANLVADTTSNANQGAEFATINLTRTAGVTTALPTPGSATVVVQNRTLNSNVDIRPLGGASVNFATTFH